MREATEIIKKVASQTNRVILFHSASGKDSIALLDLVYPHFEEIVCVYMHVVKDLSHINRYLMYAMQKYPKCKFIQVSHFAVASYIKTGYMGCQRDQTQKLYNLTNIVDIIKERTGIEWVCLGFKQSDSMNRRIMLKTYQDVAIDEKRKKFYPLSIYKNNDVLKYISDNDLIKPERYGKGQSAGTNISDMDYLLWLRVNHPTDLAKVISNYPMTERMLFEHDYERTKTE